MIEIEVCANSVESIIAAAKGGAKRVEICANLEQGGTTPPLSWVQYSIEHTDLQTFAIIRPRESDFLYSENEYITMKSDIISFGEVGAHGIVIGLLTQEGKVDVVRSKKLVDLAKSYNMSVTFHRAIDRTVNIMDAIEDIIDIGCDRILTSGGMNTAIEGKDIIKQMIEKANGRIGILPGSGIDENNIKEITDYLGVKEIHGSFREIRKSRMNYLKNDLGAYENEYTYKVTSAQKIIMAIERANNV